MSAEYEEVQLKSCPVAYESHQVLSVQTGATEAMAQASQIHTRGLESSPEFNNCSQSMIGPQESRDTKVANNFVRSIVVIPWVLESTCDQEQPLATQGKVASVDCGRCRVNFPKHQKWNGVLKDRVLS
eukprot:5883366-Amphidinium_carterae.1